MERRRVGVALAGEASPTGSYTTDDLPAGYTWQWGRATEEGDGEGEEDEATSAYVPAESWAVRAGGSPSSPGVGREVARGTPPRVAVEDAPSPGGLFEDDLGVDAAASPRPSRTGEESRGVASASGRDTNGEEGESPSVFSLDGIQVGAFQCPFESMYFWICRRKERLVLLIDLGRSRVSNLETAWLRTGARLERSPFATRLYDAGSRSFAGCLAFEVGLGSIEGWRYENPLIGCGRLALEVSSMRRREFEDVPTAKLFYAFLGGLERAARSPAVSRSVRERMRRQKSWRSDSEQEETLSTSVLRSMEKTARTAMERSPLVSRLFTESHERQEQETLPRASLPSTSRLRSMRTPASAAETPSKGTQVGLGHLARRWNVRAKVGERDGMLEARTLQLRFSDPHLPRALRNLLVESAGMHTSGRLLSLHESGIPAWALVMAGLGLPYRPWMRHRLRNLFVLLTLLSCLMGCYDLVARKLPLLLDLGLRLYVVILTAIPLRWVNRGKLALRTATSFAGVALGHLRTVAVSTPVLRGVFLSSSRHVRRAVDFLAAGCAQLEGLRQRVVSTGPWVAPPGFIGPQLPASGPPQGVAARKASREWGLGGTMWFWSPSLADDARQTGTALWRACIEAWRSFRTVLSAVGMAVGSLARHRQSLVRVVRDCALRARWWAWQHASDLVRTASGVLGAASHSGHMDASGDSLVEHASSRAEALRAPGGDIRKRVRGADIIPGGTR